MGVVGGNFQACEKTGEWFDDGELGDKLFQQQKRHHLFSKYIILEMKALLLLIKENYKINSILKMLLIKYEKNAKK